MAKFLREYSLELSSMIFMIGIIMTVFVMMKYLFEGGLPYFLKNILDGIGGWIVWMTVVGPILLMGGGWYFFDGIRKRREFTRLVTTDSKAVFVRNLDRIEELAYFLTQKHRDTMEERRKELRVK
ncbi:MAG: DUF3198 domain-containing protein [Methanomassiliicoccales archaeon]|nr:MAG: DUF3198 domain-containing protein [Methanomassiliicoccales archaeon]